MTRHGLSGLREAVVGQQVSVGQLVGWGLAFLLVAALVVCYFVYRSDARPLLSVVPISLVSAPWLS